MADIVGYRACNQCGAISTATRGLKDGPCEKCGCAAYCLSDTEDGAASVRAQLVATLHAIEHGEVD